MTDDKSPDTYSGKWWCKELKAAEKELDQNWRTGGDSIVNRYLDRRETGQSSLRKYNIFWANVQILKSALYATPPKPVVSRQNGDSKDDVARTAALMLQRILQIGLTKDQSDSHEAFRMCVEDRLIPGLGQVWHRLDVETEKYTIPAVQYPDPLTGELLTLAPAQEAERIIKEEVVTEYVHWRDFIWSPARTWDEVWWVARRVWMKKKAFIARFGQDKYKDIKSTYDTMSGDKDTLPKGFKKGRVEVFEIWCEDTNKVYFVNDSMDKVLDEKEDPLQLDNFFPCPKPLLATHTTNDLTPRPDFVMCQDQYDELDTLNDRINVLTRALRVVGVYDKTNDELKNLLSGGEFRMVAVDSWASLSEKGGIAKAVDWFPVEHIAKVLDGLVALRKEVIAQIYELTSISDIMRGSSSPRETAKAQQLKAQYSSVRLQLTQQEVAYFVQSSLRIKAEIIARHLQPQTIIQMSQVEFTESAKFAQPAVELLKNYQASEYRLEISEESLSMADYNAEREMRTELISAIGQFLSQSAVMVKDMPSALPYLLRIIQWVVASFRGSTDIESVLDEAITAATQMPPTPPETKPDPAVEARAKAESQMAIDNNQNQHALGQIAAEGMKELIVAKQEQKNADKDG